MALGPHISFTADTRQAVAQVTKLQLQFQASLGSMNAVAAVSAMALKGLGVSILALGGAAMVTYGAVSSFNQSLTHVRALGDLTQKDMNRLAESINNVSVAYGVSGDVIADGTVILAKAGLTVNEINDAIGAMTALSKANAISFEEAATMTVFAVQSFKKSYSEVTDILDKMQVAAQRSILDIGDLQKAFAYAGSTAMMTGVSYEELLAIMAVLSDRALEAGISARSTNKMLLDIVQHSDKLEDFYRSMGKNFDIIQDGQLNVTELIAALSDATINVEFLQEATGIFTVRALRSFGLLAGAADDYAEMLDAINNAAGELQRTVDVQLESLSARLEILKLRMLSLLRSPEIIAGLDLMVTGFETLAMKLIPEFTRALGTATKAFATILADENLIGMFSTLVKIMFNFISVAGKFVQILSAGEGRLIKWAIAFKLIQMFSVGFISTMLTLNQTFRDQLNQLTLLTFQKEQARLKEEAWHHSNVQNTLAIHAATQAHKDQSHPVMQNTQLMSNLRLEVDKNKFSLDSLGISQERFKQIMGGTLPLLSSQMIGVDAGSTALHRFNMVMNQDTAALDRLGVALGKGKLDMAMFRQEIIGASQAGDMLWITEDQLALATSFLTLRQKEQNLTWEEFKLKMAGAENAMQRFQMQMNLIATTVTAVTSALTSAVSMGLMFATMDFSGPLKHVMMLSAAMNVFAFGVMTATMYMQYLKAASMAPDPFTAVAIGTAAAALMAGAMYATYSMTKGDWETESAVMGTQLAGLQSKYSGEGTVPAADTGMFARRTYDEGGTIGPRHQLVYVEPGEQIISKTQGMVGMGGGITVNVGDVYAQDGTDFAEKLASALPIALRNVSYRGAF